MKLFLHQSNTDACMHGQDMKRFINMLEIDKDKVLVVLQHEALKRILGLVVSEGTRALRQWYIAQKEIPRAIIDEYVETLVKRVSREVP